MYTTVLFRRNKGPHVFLVPRNSDYFAFTDYSDAIDIVIHENDKQIINGRFQHGGVPQSVSKR